jgi:hypothetical protein
MRPQDIVVLLKLISLGKRDWTQLVLARELFMSQSEISESLSRSKYAGLLGYEYVVNKQALLSLLQYGIPYIYPQHPGEIQRGIATAHSAPPLNQEIQSNEPYVWPYAKGNVRGKSVKPLYHSVVHAIVADSTLYALLALTDALRVGRARERNLAIKYLHTMIC